MGRSFKNLLFAFNLFCFTLFLYACDKTESVDITEHEWELLKVKSEGEKAEKPSGDFKNPDAYTLRFENDTLFWFDTDVNMAGGYYGIPQKGDIWISHYRNSTLVGSPNRDFNDRLFRVFNGVNSYTVKRGFRMTLICKGPKGAVKFKEK